MYAKPERISVSHENPYLYDKLNREVQVKNLLQIIKNLDNPTTIAVDGNFGCGKSTFAEMLHCELTTNKHQTVYYNAWESDFIDNPLLSIITQLTTQLAEKDNKISSVKNKIKGMAESVGPIILDVAAKKLLGLATDQLVEKYADSKEKSTIKNQYSDLFKDVKIEDGIRKIIAGHRVQQQTIEAFRRSLSDYVQAVQKKSKVLNLPLVIFIDELDRCKPTFAIQTLEIIKHFFDVPNVVFCLITNLEQLNHTVNLVYGNNVNSSAYLSRFIDIKIRLTGGTTYHELPKLLSNYDKVLTDSKGVFYSLTSKNLHAYLSNVFFVTKCSRREVEKFLYNLQIYIDFTKSRSRPVNLANLIFLMACQHFDYELFCQFVNREIDNEGNYANLLRRCRQFFHTSMHDDGLHFMLHTAFKDKDQLFGLFTEYMGDKPESNWSSGQKAFQKEYSKNKDYQVSQMEYLLDILCLKTELI